MVAWPQRSTSCVGVKNRTCRSASVDDETKAVSLTASSRAIARHCSAESPSASGSTPAALPESGSVVKASTRAIRRVGMRRQSNYRVKRIVWLLLRESDHVLAAEADLFDCS